MKLSKTTRLLALLVATVLTAGAVFAVREYRQSRFVRHLDLVSFSTSLIGGPSTGKLRQAGAEADRLGVDLFAAYTANLDTPRRYDLAALLIARQSPAYLAFISDHVSTIPWPEVRLWRLMRDDATLGPPYRAALLQAILASPTSEGRLAAGRWYEQAGRPDDSAAAYLAVLPTGPSLDSIDAAFALAASPRHRAVAVRHLLAILEKPFAPAGLGDAAAWRLIALYQAQDQLKPLMDAYQHSPNADTWRPLAAALEKLAAADPALQSPP